MAKRYVQHISGQGEKWEVWGAPFDPDDSDWRVRSKARNDCHYLPLSEYRLCEPPVVWKDVTGECEIRVDGTIVHKGVHTAESSGYRRRKEKMYTPGGMREFIIIEQKVE